MSETVKQRSDRFKVEVWDRKITDALGTKVEVLVVAKRCVYLNNHRIAGGKPYASENLPHHTFQTTLGEVLDAFSDDEILKAIADRKHNRELVAAWQQANPYRAPEPTP
jgi:hypothetical protein